MTTNDNGGLSHDKIWAEFYKEEDGEVFRVGATKGIPPVPLNEDGEPEYSEEQWFAMRTEAFVQAMTVFDFHSQPQLAKTVAPGQSPEVPEAAEGSQFIICDAVFRNIKIGDGGKETPMVAFYPQGAQHKTSHVYVNNESDKEYLEMALGFPLDSITLHQRESKPTWPERINGTHHNEYRLEQPIQIWREPKIDNKTGEQATWTNQEGKTISLYEFGGVVGHGHYPGTLSTTYMSAKPLPLSSGNGSDGDDEGRTSELLAAYENIQEFNLSPTEMLERFRTLLLLQLEGDFEEGVVDLEEEWPLARVKALLKDLGFSVFSKNKNTRVSQANVMIQAAKERMKGAEELSTEVHQSANKVLENMSKD